VTASSGPGLALKTEGIGLAVAAELPLIVVNVQRAGPSTGMPTKPEQSDLEMMIHGRHGESPAAVVAPATSEDCFHIMIDAARISIAAMTPAIVLSDAFLANAVSEWVPPDLDKLTDAILSIRGVTLGIKLTDQANGAIRVDFNKDVSMMAPFAKQMFLEVLSDNDALIPELEQWNASVVGNRITLEGVLSNTAMRQIFSLVDFRSAAASADVPKATSTVPRGGDDSQVLLATKLRLGDSKISAPISTDFTAICKPAARAIIATGIEIALLGLGHFLFTIINRSFSYGIGPIRFFVE